MATKPLVSYATFFALLLFCFILTTSEIRMVEAVCKKRSTTWSGVCIKTESCDRQCKNWEGAKHGACHVQGFGRACFCYFDHC
ncbi:hypothetical protein AQUCO_01000542v1 [Aquilegia coerulea]|uniref:Knottins-like domain-containing protein n=1 Tax=Aquilegia coerulea TaxID=218851 RepID=A0A2G5EAH4_AQUCA|nr:hypothetical protein AQUCO_01000542v1 [Aquilegia coerulea]